MGEAVIIQINIVGLISNEEEIDEIENIAKVFLIEEKMLDLTYEIKKPIKILDEQYNPMNKNVSYLTVRELK